MNLAKREIPRKTKKKISAEYCWIELVLECQSKQQKKRNESSAANKKNFEGQVLVKEKGKMLFCVNIKARKALVGVQ